MRQQLSSYFFGYLLQAFVMKANDATTCLADDLQDLNHRTGDACTSDESDLCEVYIEGKFDFIFDGIDLAQVDETW